MGIVAITTAIKEGRRRSWFKTSPPSPLAKMALLSVAVCAADRRPRRSLALVVTRREISPTSLCGWLYRRAVATGSPYWWNRYYQCTGYY